MDIYSKLVEESINPLRIKNENILHCHKLYLKSMGCTSFEIEKSLNIYAYEENKRVEKIKTEIQNGLNHFSDFFITQNKKLKNISLLDGDFHSNRVPIKLDFENESFVLKYGEVAPWYLVEKYISEFSNRQTEIVVNNDNLLSSKWYLRNWTEPSFSGSPKNQSSSIGSLCALCFYFNIIDIHFENYVTTENGVYPIDIECILNNFENLTHSFDPVFIGIINPEIGLDDLNGNDKFNYYADPFLQYNKISIIEKAVKNEHIIKNSDGTYASMINYIEDFKYGFNSTITKLIDNKLQILQTVFETEFLTRKIFRPTRFYKVVLNELKLYGPLFNDIILKKRFSFAGDINLFPRISMKNWEYKQLKEGNIPIFHVHSHSGQIYSDNKKTSFFASSSPISIFEKKIKLITIGNSQLYLKRLTNSLEMPK